MPKIPSWCQIVIVEGAQVLLTRGYDDDEQAEVMRTRFRAPDFFGPDTDLEEITLNLFDRTGTGFTPNQWQTFCDPKQVKRGVLLTVVQMKSDEVTYH